MPDPDHPVSEVMDRNFVVVDVDSTADYAHSTAPSGYVAVVTRQGVAAGVLTEDRLPRAAGAYLASTLTLPDTPLDTIWLTGPPEQQPPQLCALCEATIPPHSPAFYEVDYTTNTLAPTCTVHPGTRIFWVTPCTAVRHVQYLSR